MNHRGVVLQLVVILMIDDRPLIVAAACKESAHIDRRITGQRILAVALAQVLKARFVHNSRSINLRVADLERMLFGSIVVSLRRQRELTDAVVVLSIAKVLI